MDVKKRFSRGIVLITTLLAAVLAFMVLVAAMALVPGAGAMATDVATKEQAMAAARSGVDYVCTRMQSSFGWDAGLAAGTTTDVITTSTMSVREDHGNVIGVIAFPTGEKAEFLCRFSPQNGSGAGNPSYIIPNPYLSVNALAGGATTPVYLGGSAPNWSVQTSYNYQCPSGRAVVFVQGLSGPGMRSVTVSNPAPGYGKVAQKVIETLLSPDGSQLLPNLMYGASAVSIGPPSGGSSAPTQVTMSSAGGAAPEIFSGGQLAFSSSSGDFQLATTGSFSGSTQSAGTTTLNTGAIPLSDLSRTTLSFGAPTMPKLPYSQINTAASSGTACKLPAGIYQWRSGKLYYINAEYSPLTGVLASLVPLGVQVSNDFSNVASSGGALALSNGNTVTISQDVLVTPTLTASSVAFVTSGTPLLDSLNPLAFGQHENDNSIVVFAGANGAVPVLSTGGASGTTTGNVFIEGQVQGAGSITSTGSISQTGTGFQLNPGYGQKVNMYAQGDISLTSTVVNGAGIGTVTPVQLNGIVYTWGSFTASTPGQNFAFTGSMTAYGGNPTGPPGLGLVTINSQNTSLTYDSSYVSGMLSSGSTPLRPLLWVAY